MRTHLVNLLLFLACYDYKVHIFYSNVSQIYQDDFKIKTDIVTQKAQSISTKPTFLQCRLYLESVFFTGKQVRKFNK